MDAESRRQSILRLIETNGRLTVDEVSYQFAISMRTARRDLNILAERGLAKRIHGGVSALRTTGSAQDDDAEELPIFARTRLNVHYKNKIGQAAAAMIPQGSRVVIDAGTTAFYVARHIAPDLRGEVLTNGLLTANELAPRKMPKLRILGGTLRPETYSIVGPTFVPPLKDERFDLCFMGTTGIHLRRGLTTSDDREARVKRMMMEVSSKIIVVADYSKFGHISLYGFSDLKGLYCVITDERVPPATVEQFAKSGVKIVVAR